MPLQASVDRRVGQGASEISASSCARICSTSC
jgi:hypothetical protein